jgi:hypothetical protein
MHSIEGKKVVESSDWIITEAFESPLIVGQEN